MTHPVSTCSEHHSIDWVMNEMTNHRFRHIPIIDDGRLAGIVSIGDVVKLNLRLPSRKLRRCGNIFRRASLAGLQTLPPRRQIGRWNGDAIAAHGVEETPHGHAALLNRIFSLVKVEETDAVEMNLDRSVGRIAGEP